ncbi:unnamed protein product [Medioppia subpectinata]|uniref:UBA-like domain-containing protein n=1 Tax=Medioppia subpectinata TaxID=1979941 RepID=A0A7R9Q5H8_9ACAR|nr:unnamed protein product [Medioppia subpectinata]CAG2112806.1 unnamed protein product [Medioppia subpectinata]
MSRQHNNTHTTQHSDAYTDFDGRAVLVARVVACAMDEANSESSFELTSDQTETVLQFQELTGIEDLDRCKDILQQQNWDLEIAVRLTLDSVDSNANSAANNEPSVRHRHLVANTSRDNGTDNSHANNNTVNNNNNVEYRRAETRLTVWSFIARVISSPFAFIYDTFVSLLQFALSLIRADPTRQNHSNDDI